MINGVRYKGFTIHKILYADLHRSKGSSTSDHGKVFLLYNCSTRAETHTVYKEFRLVQITSIVLRVQDVAATTFLAAGFGFMAKNAQQLHRQSRQYVS